MAFIEFVMCRVGHPGSQYHFTSHHITDHYAWHIPELRDVGLSVYFANIQAFGIVSFIFAYEP